MRLTVNGAIFIFGNSAGRTARFSGRVADLFLSRWLKNREFRRLATKGEWRFTARC